MRHFHSFPPTAQLAQTLDTTQNKNKNKNNTNTNTKKKHIQQGTTGTHTHTHTQTHIDTPNRQESESQSRLCWFSQDQHQQQQQQQRVDNTCIVSTSLDRMGRCTISYCISVSHHRLFLSPSPSVSVVCSFSIPYVCHSFLWLGTSIRYYYLILSYILF